MAGAVATPLVTDRPTGPSRTRLAAAVALVAAAVVTVVLLLAGGDAEVGTVSWKGEVQVFQSERPTDQVLYAQLENTGLRPVELDVSRVRALDASGGEVRSATTFLAAFAHGIWGWSLKEEATDFERRRLGQIATLQPGQSVPITLSWRGQRPAKVQLAKGIDLPIPPVPTSPTP